MKGEIICVGTELLLGEVLNTNVQYIARGLKECGVSVYYQTTVGDNAERLKQCVLESLSRSDIVILSGGLGPTGDDITKESVAAALGLATHLDDGILEKIKNYFAQKGVQMSENNVKQAEIPDDAVPLANPNGTAPGIYINHSQKHIFMLPGVPSEMKPMFDNEVMPILTAIEKKHIVSHTVLVFGRGESEIDDKLSDIMSGSDPTVSPYCKTGEVILRVAALCENAEYGELSCKGAIGIIKERLGASVVGVDVPDIETVVVEILKQKGLRIAIAESCTGGLVSQKLTSVSGASEVFDFAACTYSNNMKCRLLGVKKETVDDFGAVSRQTAEQMAVGIAKYAKADIGISVTGVAGPKSSENKPVGLVYVALACKDDILCRELKIFTKNSDRNTIRELTAKNALDMVRLYLADK